MDKRFLTLSPTILCAFQVKHEESLDGKVFAADMPEFTLQFEKMKDYDEFFQKRVFSGRPTAGLTIEQDGHYTVVDFQGWMYRPINFPTALEFAK